MYRRLFPSWGSHKKRLTVPRLETIVFKSLARNKLTGTIEEIQPTLNLVLLSRKGIAV